ncbi:Similar to Cadm1: Cell adhesion molecule 1 (Rattus norvegicus) [Cotesia congregata]|uniref:Similar to Cadm1: Cell adhesion molecule 1 (Rattus norvegicus) n=1 Tax=Cotesia congregata TaxID=51543 RepID=A0A8J2MRC5_COTCN|nr:Similar to Cadm1: Cell adhesion molecule 1 (Rattus norvegicus) [Cotesia congregata]
MAFGERVILRGVYFFVVLFFCVNADENWDRDDDPISTSEVTAVLGKSASLPCDIEPSTRGDGVYMILWFRDNAVKPIYSIDARGRSFHRALNWSDEDVRPRANFVTISKPAALILDSIQLSDEGIYRCRVDFRKSPTRNFQVNLTVTYPPRELLMYDTSGRKIDTVVETDGHVDTNGQNVIFSTLIVPKLTREHLNTTYKCRATSTKLVPPLEKTVLLDVYLKPESVTIVSKPSQLVSGELYNLSCEVTGSHPRAKVHWLEGNEEFKSGSIIERSNSTVVYSTLEFYPTPEDHRKQLRCRGDNPALSNAFIEDSYHLNVVFPPKVQLEIGNTLNAQNIKEEDDVYFECKVRANPEHNRITWKHNGITLMQNPTAGIVMSSQNLVLQKIKRENGGNYTCLARASMDESVKIRCEVDADPNQVDFTWEFNNSGENFELAPAKFDGNNGTASEFLYTPMSERDYGALTCWGRNAIGKQKTPCVYQVIPAVKPSPVNNCTLKALLNQTLESLDVECAAGYDGGLRQDFRLEAYEAQTNLLRVNISSISPEAPVFRIPVADLLPANHFYLMVYAINAKGRSEVSLLEDIILRDSGKQTDTGVSFIPLLLLLIGCLMTLGITVLSVMLMFYRRRGTTSPVHVEPYMKQPIISPPDSRNNSMLDVTHGDHTYFVEYTLKQVGDYALNQPDIIQSPQDQEKVKREPQLFLPVRPDTLFAPYDIHKQGLQTNKCTLNPFSTKSWEPISFKADRNMMKEIIIANSIPGPESCV